MSNNDCVACHAEDLGEDEALDCDQCKRWQHLRCGVDISSTSYWNAADNDAEINWICPACQADDEEPISPIQHVGAEVFTFDNVGEDETSDPAVVATINRSSTTNEIEMQESSLSGPSTRQESAISDVADETTYQLAKGVSTRGGNKLYDSKGYSYTLQKTNKNGSKLWRCSVRGKGNLCHATIKESSTGFSKGLREHNHPGKLGTMEMAIIAKKTKDQAMKDPLSSAPPIANKLLDELAGRRHPVEALRPVEYLARNANYARRQLRPSEPDTLEFELYTDAIPDDFLIDDKVMVGDERHLVFAKAAHLRLLEKAKTWYVDATFQVVKRPFYQLFTIHAVMKSGDEIKQLPLAVVMMSRRSKSDYVAVLKVILGKLTAPRVRRVVTDFERATWAAFREVLPAISIKGCAFHFVQAVWHNIKDLGLARSYRRRTCAHDKMRKLMALCYLPGNTIKAVFKQEKKKNGDTTLNGLYAYFEKTWITDKTWRPRSWSVYQMPIRTNNDLEGWHNKLNKEGRPKMPLYLLITLLDKLAQNNRIQITLLSSGEVRRRRRTKSKETDATPHAPRRKHRKGKKTREQPPRAAPKVAGPRT